MKSILELRKEVIHVTSQSDADLLCQIFDNLGLKWCNKTSYVNNTEWSVYQFKMCYCPHEGVYSSIDFWEGTGYKVYGVDQIREFQEAKNKFMKTTKQKLLTIYGKDGCNEFNNTLEEILKSQFKISDTTEFLINQKYLDLAKKRCSTGQKNLLNSIGITFGYSNWSRTHSVGNNEYFFLERGKSGEPFKVEKGSNAAKPAITCYKTREIAEREVKIFSLMMIMRNWAIYHNQIDNFIPDWQSGSQQKFGLMLHSGNKLSIISRYGDNEFLFFITL
ncbi:MAG: hypothetical protein DI622_22820, partial [Chryseobacterium sp.]